MDIEQVIERSRRLEDLLRQHYHAKGTDLTQLVHSCDNRFPDDVSSKLNEINIIHQKLMTEDGFSILNIPLISLWNKTGILHCKAVFQIFQDPDIPRGWRGNSALLLQNAVCLLTLCSPPAHNHLACSCSASISALGQV